MGYIHTAKSRSHTPKDYLHPVTRQYVQKFIRDGIRVPTDLGTVDNFVTRMCSIVYPSFWVAYLLKSQHNAGSGTTVYSIGNSQIRDGLLVNGPTWGNDGLTFATDSSTGRNRSILVSPWSESLINLRENSTVIGVSNFGEQNVSSNYDTFILGSNASTNGGYCSFNTREGIPVGDINFLGPGSLGNVSYATLNTQTLTTGIWRLFGTQRQNNVATNSNTQGNKLWLDNSKIAAGSNSAQVGFETITSPSVTLNLGNARGNTSLAPVGQMSIILIIQDWSVSIPYLRNLLKETINPELP